LLPLELINKPVNEDFTHSHVERMKQTSRCLSSPAFFASKPLEQGRGKRGEEGRERENRSIYM
jgi:hypothetical protein